jgi:hypothetical protein
LTQITVLSEALVSDTTVARIDPSEKTKLLQYQLNHLRIFTETDFAADTLPAASLTQAYAVLVPLPDENVKLDGAELFHPVAVAAGFVALSVIR